MECVQKQSAYLFILEDRVCVRSLLVHFTKHYVAIIDYEAYFKGAKTCENFLRIDLSNVKLELFDLQSHIFKITKLVRVFLTEVFRFQSFPQIFGQNCTHKVVIVGQHQ